MLLAGFPALVLPFAFSPAYGSHELGSVVPFALILTISSSLTNDSLNLAFDLVCWSLGLGLTLNLYPSQRSLRVIICALADPACHF
jgi:hypothetical protein